MSYIVEYGANYKGFNCHGFAKDEVSGMNLIIDFLKELDNIDYEQVDAYMVYYELNKFGKFEEGDCVAWHNAGEDNYIDGNHDWSIQKFKQIFIEHKY